MKRGLMLIDRGSREREAEEELEIICEKVKQKGNYDFTEFCFLEVVPPFIEDGMEKCLKKDVDEMTIVPYFLYPGKKVKMAVADAMKYQKDTKIKFLVSKPMTMHKTLVDLVDNRIVSTLEKNEISLSKDKVDVLIIGHGSKDPNAGISINYIVENLKNTYKNVARCYLEIEEPNIEQGIRTCEKNNPDVLVIVFYFLHEGAHVKTDINNDLNPALEKSNLKKVCITKHLGTDEKMIDLIIERAKEVENAN
jgi:sirohydrochlorin ferrochelatase